MKHYRIVLLMIAIFISLAIPVFAEESHGACKDVVSICNSPRLVVELEQARILQEQNKVLQQTVDELANQVVLLNREVELLQEKIKLTKQLQEETEKIDNERINQLQKELKEAKKPRYKSMFASAGVGSIVTLLVVLAISL